MLNRYVGTAKIFPHMRKAFKSQLLSKTGLVFDFIRAKQKIILN